MNIGIIVYSNTGNTLSIAERLQAALLEAGHTVRIEHVRANADKSSVTLTETPDVSGFDALILGSPVHAFSLAPAMLAYLTGPAALEGKSAALFVTQHFPKPWMGGKRALGQMTAACRAKGASIGQTGIVNWSAKTRQEQIDQLTRRFCGR